MNEDPQTAATSKAKKSGGISIRGLRLLAGGRTLLDNVDADFAPGEITLIVGPSGVGKSVLLKKIADIIDRQELGIESHGHVFLDGKSVSKGDVGVVFQSFALFDEWSPQRNVEFAQVSGGRRAHPQPAGELLKELNIPAEVPTSRLSGGQKQRLAIARTIAYNPPTILYDEPTSGLDPATAKQVAQLIRDTHQSWGETTLVVTHDYVSLIPIADSVFVLDSDSKTLVKLEREEFGNLAERLEGMSSDFVQQGQESRRKTWIQRSLHRVTQFFAGTTDAVWALIVGILSLLPLWKNPTWGLRYLRHYCWLVFGPTALIYLFLAGIISGFVTTYFTFKFLPYATYTEPLLIEDLLTGLGFAMYRIFVPVLGCVLIAARCGAAVTSDVGGRQYGNQIDAMQTFGKSPRAYLLTPIVLAFLLGTPLLYLSSYVGARMTSLFTFVQSYPERGPDFWHYNFHRGLIVAGQDFYLGTSWLISKLLVSGFGVALISYYVGRKPKYSSNDVSRGVTTTILLATLFVLIVHFAFSFFEYEGVVPGATVPGK